MKGLVIQASGKGVLVIPSGVIAACFALVCFAAAIVVGLAVGNDALTVLWRSILVMGAAWLVGRVVGAAVQRTLEEHVERYKQANPAPDAQATSAEGQSSDTEAAPEATETEHPAPASTAGPS